MALLEPAVVFDIIKVGLCFTKRSEIWLSRLSEVKTSMHNDVTL